MRRKNHTKKQNQRFHARKRAMERYGISYNKDILSQIISMIANNETKLLEKKSLRLSIREAMLGNKCIRFVYDRERKEIVTFLPSDSLGQTLEEKNNE